MNTILYRKGIRYSEREYKKESDIEELVINHSKTLFGNNSIYIDAKKKIDNTAFGGVIPDGFLFDLTDSNNPEFYIVEVELSKHSFFNHIFPQITKFFAFFKNPDSQGKLTEKLYEIFEKDEQLKIELKSEIGNREIFKFLKDTIENSQNILIIIDNEKPEFSEIIETYTDTWGKMVRIAILKEYYRPNGQDDTIITMTPDFENIENIDIVSIEQDKSSKPTNYTIDFHLDGIPKETKELFDELRCKLIEKIPTLSFNPQRYYISLRKKRNFAFLRIKKKKITIVAMMREEEIRRRIKNYNTKTLSQGVQNFYNGPCARIELTDNKNLNEVIELLLAIQK
jgi:predicted transport protein